MGRLQVLFDLSLYGYLLAAIVYAVWFFWRGRKAWLAGTALMSSALALQVGYIVAMTIVGGRPPLANTFETLVFFSACVSAMFLLSVRSCARTVGSDRCPDDAASKPLAPLAALASLFATLFAYLMMQDEVEPVAPALRDNLWLTVHVVFCFVSYAAFLLAYIGALGFLAKDERHAGGSALSGALSVSGVIAALVVVGLSGSSAWEESRAAVLGAAAGGAVLLALGLWPLVGWSAAKLRIRERLPEKSQLERMVYRTVSLGFPFLTLGIVTGSYWADQTWGRYWGWDDKEVASLVTWLVFAVFLHLRLVPRWPGFLMERGAALAWVAVAGFWCVLFTYFGVNYLMSGLHSYA